MSCTSARRVPPRICSLCHGSSEAGIAGLTAPRYILASDREPRASVLRNIFVFLIIVVGIFYAAQGPFYALLFYLWNAYFRPEQWVWGGEVLEMRLSLVIGLYLVVTALLSTRSLRLNTRT